MRCYECKHYNLDPFNANETYGLARCDKARELFSSVKWEEETLEYVIQPEYSENKMFVQDGSGYSASLYVKPDFFCAHFEEKTK